jgi:Ca2+-binding EF-hand superfamily protein
MKAWWREDKRFQKLQLNEAELARMQQAQQYFNHFDKDRSGTISKKEFAALHADLVKHKYRIPENVDQALAQLDSDNSGVVSFNEFIAWLGMGGF